MSSRLENNAIQLNVSSNDAESIYVLDGSQSLAGALFVAVLLVFMAVLVRRLFCKGFPGCRSSPASFS